MSRFRRVQLIGLIVLALFAGLAVLTIRETCQAQRDQDLIATIRNADATAVATLLKQGANPNAHESPEAVGPLWRRLLALLHPSKRSKSTRSVMQLAIYRDVYGPMPTDAIVTALKQQGATDAADPKATASSLAWVGRLLDSTTPPPPTTDDYRHRYDVTDALEAYSNILVKFGPSAAAYHGRARCRLRLGNYDLAVSDLRLAMLWAPADTNIRNLLAEAAKLTEVSTFARPREATIDNRDTVLYARRFPVPGQADLWAVLQGNTESRNPSNVHLAIYAERGHNDYRLLWRSGALIDPQMNSGKNAEYWEVHLSVCRLTGGGSPEVVVQEMSPGGSWSPAHMDIFAWRNSRMEHILDVSSSQPLWFEDLRHDGTYQARNSYEIGSSSYLSHGAQPRWSDVYAYKNGRYVLADRDFPSAFAKWPALLKGVLQRHPQEPELPKYLVETEAILHHRPTTTIYTGRTTSRFAPLLPSNDSDE